MPTIRQFQSALDIETRGIDRRAMSPGGNPSDLECKIIFFVQFGLFAQQQARQGAPNVSKSDEC